MPGNPSAIKVRPFARADPIISSVYLNFDLTLCYRYAAAVSGPPDTETRAEVFDEGSTDLHVQFVRIHVSNVEISISFQKFDSWRLGIAHGDHAIGVQADVYVRGGRHGEALPLHGLMNPGCRGFGDKPGHQTQRHSCGHD